MTIVIEIPEEYYNAIKAIPDIQCTADMLIIKNGTPLPKGHGRIIDESKINTIYCETEMELYGSKIRYIKKTDAPTIIEGSEGEK